MYEFCITKIGHSQAQQKYITYRYSQYNIMVLVGKFVGYDICRMGLKMLGCQGKSKEKHP